MDLRFYLDFLPLELKSNVFVNLNIDDLDNTLEVYPDLSDNSQFWIQMVRSNLSEYIIDPAIGYNYKDLYYGLTLYNRFVDYYDLLQDDTNVLRCHVKIYKKLKDVLKYKDTSKYLLTINSFKIYESYSYTILISESGDPRLIENYFILFRRWDETPSEMLRSLKEWLINITSKFSDFADTHNPSNFPDYYDYIDYYQDYIIAINYIIEHLESKMK